MEWLILWVLCGGVAAVVANAKNRNVGGWLVAGLIFGLLALLVIACLPTKREAEEAGEAPPAHDPNRPDGQPFVFEGLPAVRHEDDSLHIKTGDGWRRFLSDQQARDQLL